MVRRIIEFVSGAIIAICLFTSYTSPTNESKLLIWYLLTPAILKAFAWLLLFVTAGRLLFGKYKDYSKYFYNLIVKFFGDFNKNRQ